MRYRPDIDGLRAFAVLAIVGFHINSARLSGGFVGVDIFFVISGFLITGIITRDMAARQFDLATFFLKRARRLFPALFVMLLASSVMAYLILLPSELADFGSSLVASVLYYSNFYYLTQSGYFSGALENNLLLHTWSLAVEEQFYLFFPALLLLAAGFGRRGWLFVTIVLGLASLAASLWLTDAEPTAAFYISPTRIWQFAAGSLIALVPVPKRASPLVANVLSLGGLLLLVVCVFVIDASWPFPGTAALLPVVGTAAVIFAGRLRTNLGGTLLSLPPLAWVGRISYSVYLWHWPLIVGYRLTFNSQPDLVEQLMLLVVSLAVGWVSYRLVELPTRRLTLDRHRARLLVASVLAGSPFVAFGAFAAVTDGFPARFPPEVQRYASYLEYNPVEQSLAASCFIDSADDAADFRAPACIHLSPTRPNVLLLGDSHAAQYAKALALEFPEYSFSQITASGCRPLLDGGGEERCTTLMSRAFHKYVAADVFDAVILAGRWQTEDIDSLLRTAAFVDGHTGRTIVFGPVIEYRLDLPRLLAISAEEGGATEVIDDAADLLLSRSRDEAVRAALKGTGIRYRSVLNEICPDENCVTVVKGVPLQHDYGHLTLEGARYVVHELHERGLLRDLVRRPPGEEFQ